MSKAVRKRIRAKDNNEKEGWLDEFRAVKMRSLEKRIHYAFIHTFKPVLDEAPFRSFNTMKEYRTWCEKNLPSWLGYGRV